MADSNPPQGGADTLAPTQPVPAAQQGGTELLITAGDTAIRPFEYRATGDELADLKRRIEATRWPDRETVDDDTPGRPAGDHAQARRLLGERI